MSKETEDLKTQIRDAMTTLNTDAAGLSRMIGRGKDYVRDFLEGRKKTMDAISLQAINRMLREQATSQVLRGVTPAEDVSTPPPMTLFGDRDFPVYSAAEGGPGVMVVSTDPVEVVERPWFMKEVKDGYAVLIVGESMEPVFEPGDMAIVNPRLPAVRGKEAIFVQGEERGEFKATIKRLVRWDADSWYVRQFNDPRDFELDRSEWPRALRVVGKLNG